MQSMDTELLQAIESKCHTGQTILYDTVTVKGWSVDVRTHRISEIINKILVDPWPGADDDSDDLGASSVKLPGELDISIVKLSLLKWGRSLLEWGGSLWKWGRKGPGKGEPNDGGGEDGDGWEKHGGVPRAETEEDCMDCYKWYVECISGRSAADACL